MECYNAIRFVHSRWRYAVCINIFYSTSSAACRDTILDTPYRLLELSRSEQYCKETVPIIVGKGDALSVRKSEFSSVSAGLNMCWLGLATSPADLPKEKSIVLAGCVAESERFMA